MRKVSGDQMCPWAIEFAAMTRGGPWTRSDLIEALDRYERELVAAGRTPGTIATYVGDVRRFIDWLSGTDVSKSARSNAAVSARRVAKKATSVGRPMAAPESLRALVERSRGEGNPAQSPIGWPMSRWVRNFPLFREAIQRMPTKLDRSAGRDVARVATESEDAAVAAFIASMAWGFGAVGYGPYRTQQMLLRTPRGSQLLQSVAVAVRDHGAVAGYGKLSSECRIKGLGPAFGTNYIAFCQPEGQLPTALIHDELVSAWLSRNGRPDLSTTSWVPRVYEAYLDQMAAWGHELNETPERL